MNINLVHELLILSYISARSLKIRAASKASINAPPNAAIFAR